MAAAAEIMSRPAWPQFRLSADLDQWPTVLNSRSDSIGVFANQADQMNDRTIAGADLNYDRRSTLVTPSHSKSRTRKSVRV